MKVLHELPSYITNILTDSRRITTSDIESGKTAFVAMRTSVGDGHRYVRKLYDRGLRSFIVDDAEEFKDLVDAAFVVAPEGTLDFLIKVAGERLRQSLVEQIVITGSNKKTTAKELIYRALLKSGKNVARSPRTWNSAMGVTLSLFDNLAQNPEVIVTEVGIDAPGQASRLRPLLRPSIGVITGITDEHDENFESHAAKVSEKISLVKNASKLVYLKGDTELEAQIKSLQHPHAIGVDNIEDLVGEVTGCPCPADRISTAIEVRRIPEDGVLFIDSFTNDLASLPLSLAMAAERRAGRRLAVFLGDFEGNSDEAERLVAERDGKVLFFEKKDSNFVKHLHRGDFAHHLVLIKGATSELITFFDEARHDTTLQVDLDALVHNYNVYRRLLPPHTGIIGMVKADAYGLGALEVAKTLQNHGARYLAVAVVDEAISLRQAGITMPIIVLNPITNRFEALVDYHLEPAVFSLEELSRIDDAISALGSSIIPVHIKLDTGMHRIGFITKELEILAQRLKNSKTVKVASIFSHLATADCLNDEKDEYTRSQMAAFDDMSSYLSAQFGDNIPRHLLNTAGIERFGRTDAAYDMARLGLGLYGISPATLTHGELRPTARLISTVISLKHWPSGTPIGYGGRDVTQRDSVIATLPIGYADGIDRRLGNGRARFAIDGCLCPTIGNVCMDLLMLDVTDAVNKGIDVRVGTEVEIFGPTAAIESVADTLGTITYEILTSVSPRVRRTYHQR